MATNRFFSLIKQTENAEIIEEELRAIQGKFGPEERLPQAPCPYSLFLLASAWCVDLEVSRICANQVAIISFVSDQLREWRLFPKRHVKCVDG
jgi:hypothetical protein